MTYRDRRVALEQKSRDGLADQIGAPDDDGLGPLQRHLIGVEQLDDADRRARPQARRPLDQTPSADRREAVDVLVGGDQPR